MRPQRVVIINDRSLARGGATALAVLSAKLLTEAGLAVTYVTGDAGEDTDLPPEVEIVALGGKGLLEQSFLERAQGGLYNSKAKALIDGVVERLDTPETVYHLHGWAQTLSPAVFHALRKVEPRLLISAHDFTMVCPNGTYFNFQKNEVCPLRPLGAACLASNCDKRSRIDKYLRTARSWLKNRLFDPGETTALIATIHPSMNAWLTRAGVSPDRLRTVRNPVSAFQSARVEAERNSDVFFIGRVEAEKGVDLAAEAARTAGRTLRVIGEGPERAPLSERFPEVVWEGWRSHAEIAELIGSARAVLMPSRLPEPFGLVALEALQSGVPLVAYADSFVAREAADIGAAFVAPDRSEGSLGRALSALDSDEVAAAASRNAFERCGALSTTPESWRDALLALYAELLDNAPTIGTE